MTKSEPWMEAAADLADEAHQVGDKAGYKRIMNAAEARADREGRQDRGRRKTS